MAKAKKTEEIKQEEQVEKKVKSKASKEETPAPTATLKDLLDQGSESVISEEALLEEETNEDQIEENLITPIVEEGPIIENVPVINSDELEKREDIDDKLYDKLDKEKFGIPNTEKDLVESYIEKQTTDLSQEFSKIIDEKIVEQVIEVSKTEETFELSQNAKRYKAYIEMYKITPEEFLAKYPKHKSRIFIEEIIEWKIKTGKQ